MIHRKKSSVENIDNELLQDSGIDALNPVEKQALLPACVPEEQSGDNAGVQVFEPPVEEPSPPVPSLPDAAKDIVPDYIDEITSMSITGTNLGNFIADALRHVTGADIGFINIGGMRSVNKSGNITQDDVSAAPLFTNHVVVLGLNGVQLKSVLEHSASMLPEYDGRFIQVSGITVKLDTENPVGERVVSVKFYDGSPLCDDIEYIVALNEYLSDGGDSYELLSKLPKLGEGKTVDQVFMEYKAVVDSESCDKFGNERISFTAHNISAV